LLHVIDCLIPDANIDIDHMLSPSRTHQVLLRPCYRKNAKAQGFVAKPARCRARIVKQEVIPRTLRNKNGNHEGRQDR
jgi:hypothetical protein